MSLLQASMKVMTGYLLCGIAFGVALLLLEKAGVTVAQFEVFKCEIEGIFTPIEVFDKLVTENRLAEVTDLFCIFDGLSGSFPSDLPTMPLLTDL